MTVDTVAPSTTTWAACASPALRASPPAGATRAFPLWDELDPAAAPNSPSRSLCAHPVTPANPTSTPGNAFTPTTPSATPTTNPTTTTTAVTQLIHNHATASCGSPRASDAPPRSHLSNILPGAPNRLSLDSIEDAPCSTSTGTTCTVAPSTRHVPPHQQHQQHQQQHGHETRSPLGAPPSSAPAQGGYAPVSPNRLQVRAATSSLPTAADPAVVAMNSPRNTRSSAAMAGAAGTGQCSASSSGAADPNCQHQQQQCNSPAGAPAAGGPPVAPRGAWGVGGGGGTYSPHVASPLRVAPAAAAAPAPPTELPYVWSFGPDLQRERELARAAAVEASDQIQYAPPPQPPLRKHTGTPLLSKRQSSGGSHCSASSHQEGCDGESSSNRSSNTGTAAAAAAAAGGGGGGGSGRSLSCSSTAGKQAQTNGEQQAGASGAAMAPKGKGEELSFEGDLQRERDRARMAAAEAAAVEISYRTSASSNSLGVGISNLLFGNKAVSGSRKHRSLEVGGV